MLRWESGHTLGLAIGDLLALFRREHLHDLGTGLRTQLRFTGHGAAERFCQAAGTRFVILAGSHHLMQLAPGVLDGLALLARFRHLRTGRPGGFGWMAQDLHPEGAAGDASKATPDHGAVSARFGAAALVDLLRDLRDFDMSRLKDGPLKAGPRAG